jgi:Leucine-rich repeat (LRR) protein
MKQFFISYLFFLIPILSLAQKNSGTVELGKLSQQSALELKTKVQQKYVEDLSISIDNFLSTLSSSSNGMMARSTSIPLVCVSQDQNPAPPAPPLVQYQALLSLYANNGGSSWFNKSGWQNAPATPVPVHNWAGVCVNSAGQVIGLDLSNNGLTGNLQTSFWNLTSLVYLNLGGNSLTGSLPSSIGNLLQLQYLNLRSNGFSGPIPSAIGNLTGLVSINLDGNGFTGSIPTQLGGLGNLSELILSNNSLTGSIPSELGNASNLIVLILSYNEALTNSIPSSIGNLSNLGTI